MDENSLREAALDYHRLPTPGKISVTPTKGLINQLDLSLAYSPGVAYACTAIEEDPQQAALLTSRANLVAVITNGTAVLGLGNIGPLASKPVMEGKACLFKKFAGIDVFDIEIAQNDPEKFIEIVAALEPTFGGINLEDIKAPECFIIERTLRQRMKIPVFHDDQHGTAIIVAAAVLNGLKLAGKDIAEVKVAVSGAGAAALACLDLLVNLGIKRENIFVSDIDGVVYIGRQVNMDPEKDRYAQDTKARKLADIMPGADIFLGLSAGGVLKPEMVREMAPTPIIMALANPTPEITPELAREARPDALICTGRSDYPNQVNNVLCFPYIFRGALDVGATAINEEMKKAAVHAIAELAMAEISDIVATAYAAPQMCFGPDYLIPKPFDPRLIEKIAPAVAQAAMDSGVAARPIIDMEAYRQQMARFVYHSGASMKPVFDAAKAAPKRVAYAEGEEERVLRAAQVVVDEGLAFPVLIGRAEIIAQRIKTLGLRLRLGENCEAVNILSDSRYREVVSEYYELTKRKGVTMAIAREAMRTRPTLIGAALMRRGDVDALLCGTTGVYVDHLRAIKDVIGPRPGVKTLAAMNMLMLPDRQIFICDTQVNRFPNAEQLAEITLLAAEELRRFGLVPRVALLSHSSFGSSECAEAQLMRDALALIEEMAPDLEVEGEMQGDAALSETVLAGAVSGARLTGQANLLMMPNLDAANISYGLLKLAAGNGITVGPILLGTAQPVHIIEPSASVRRIVNMTALVVVDATVHRAMDF
ncbi:MULTISPECIES: NADP-dependent malic enzyme [Rhodomicrobium]|uniref:NADP-dependent malic enzyme n=1 Tax=Rhodomicrobium TaxID=1068 RepID=UPI000B4B6BBA|nr:MULTISPECIES: NADP-dependent malic enzyme [Rhodomicrobium]